MEEMIQPTVALVDASAVRSAVACASSRNEVLRGSRNHTVTTAKSRSSFGMPSDTANWKRRNCPVQATVHPFCPCCQLGALLRLAAFKLSAPMSFICLDDYAATHVPYCAVASRHRNNLAYAT